MDYNGLMNAICDDGETEVRAAYAEPVHRDKLEGALHGFSEARMTSDLDDLKGLLVSAQFDVETARQREDSRYWYWRYRSLQIEWCANVISAAHYSAGLPGIVPPTYRGLRKAADILGIANQ